MKALVSTRKGLLIYTLNGSKLELQKAHFDGVKVSNAYHDPHTGNIWAALNHGHWGIKLHVSQDGGESFTERPSPKFSEESKRKLKDIWCIAADKKGRVYLGVEPAEIFVSDDRGETWQLLEGLGQLPEKEKWFGGGSDDACLHSIVLDSENPDQVKAAISCAGVIASEDYGKTWDYRNNGLVAEFLPDPSSNVGQDPHLLIKGNHNSQLLWQQNHCGLFKSEDAGKNWINLSEAQGVVSKFGWAVALDESDDNIVYTVPALSDESRIPVDYGLFIQKSTDGGQSWSKCTEGLPQKEAYDIVFRHAFKTKGKLLVFGSSTGNLYYSLDQAASWQTASNHLPPIYAVELC